MSDDNEFVFAPLGGLGEIGMNCALYGFGPPRGRKWLMVDLGVAFAGDDLPGVDLILPDVAFIEKVKKDLVGLVITHAHEDHIGALADLWPRLGVQVYATRFAAGLAETRRLSEPGAPKIPIKIVAPGARLDIGPFDVEFIAIAHSIPESCALAIRTPAGLVVHSGDWKIDATPMVGAPTDERAPQGIGRRRRSRAHLRFDQRAARGREPFGSRCREEPFGPGRQGEGPRRHHHLRLQRSAPAGGGGSRIRQRPAGDYHGPRDGARRRGLARMRLFRRRAALARTGPVRPHSARQGARARHRQPGRAARGAGAHRRGRASQRQPGEGDLVIFSSRTIPGNEKAVGKIINGLVTQGVEVVTDRTQLVHVSGHPRRAELAKLYAWLKPKIAVPAHGEPLHLSEHVAFAKAQGVGQVVRAFNGDVVRLADGDARVVGQLDHGRLYKDGDILLPTGDDCVGQRRSFPLPASFRSRSP